MSGGLNNPSSTQEGLLKYSKPAVSRKVTLTANAPVMLMPANDARVYVAIVNRTANAEVTLTLADPNAAIGAGIPLFNRGSSFEISSNNLYTGKISAVAASNAELSVVECSA